jgi:hypothetical protein
MGRRNTRPEFGSVHMTCHSFRSAILKRKSGLFLGFWEFFRLHLRRITHYERSAGRLGLRKPVKPPARSLLPEAFWGGRTNHVMCPRRFCL